MALQVTLNSHPMPEQLSIPELPQASYQIRAWCKQCNHQAEMIVGIEVMNSLHRLKCGNCGGRKVSIEQVKANLGS